MPLLVFRRYLGEDGARGKVGAVSFDAEGLGRVRRDENRSGGDTLFQPGKSGSLGFFPVPAGVVSGQIEERAGVFQEVLDEPSIEVGEPEEGLHLLLVCRSGPLGDTGCKGNPLRFRRPLVFRFRFRLPPPRPSSATPSDE